MKTLARHRKNTAIIHSCTMLEIPLNRSQTDLHRALVGAGGGSCRSLGMQGLAPKLIGTVLSSWTRLLDSHLCCSRCRSLFIWVHNRATPCNSHSIST